MMRTMRPLWNYGVPALGIVSGLTLLLWLALRWPLTWYHVLACWLIVINFVTVAYFRFDKGRAGSGGGRVPEAVLYTLTGLGGSGGAYLAMHLFRHKTLKGSFQLFFWFLVVMQLGLVLAVVYRLILANRATTG
jgi:uncharacterized membrane protein YsdA (DUF1294 family)